MFQKIEKTAFPPQAKPIMVWDGNCGFCAYWTTRWKKITKENINYEPYQTAAENFEDIPITHFQEASRLIEPGGAVFSGPRSAYRCFTYGKNFWSFLDRWYVQKPWFQRLSDRLYNWVAKNRSTLFSFTKAMYGSNPEETKPFWVIYLGIILYLLYTIL